MKLTVTQQFENYAVGDEITDQQKIDSVLASEQAPFVVGVYTDPVPTKKSQAVSE